YTFVAITSRDAEHECDDGAKLPFLVRGRVEGANARARPARRAPPVGCATLAVAARMVLPHSRIEGRIAIDTVRRERSSEERDSRRQSGGLLRRQDDVQAEGLRACRGLHDSVWRR